MQMPVRARGQTRGKTLCRVLGHVRVYGIGTGMALAIALAGCANRGSDRAGRTGTSAVTHSKMDSTYFAAMRSNLINLATQEEGYYQHHYSYTSSAAALGFTSSEGVNVKIQQGTTSGWAAYATNPTLDSGLGCAIYYGLPSAPSGAPVTPTKPGAISCGGN